MKLTKYEHACFTVEKDNQLLVVDPGGFSSDFIAPSRVVAIVITHGHPDHFDHELIEAVVNENPDVIIFGPETVTSKIEVFNTKTISSNEVIAIGPFELSFFVGEHSVTHPSIPITSNIGVLVNDLLYYPGDSFALPDKSVDILALPVAAPWLKISEVMDFLTQVHPRLAFPTHDAISSDIGKEVIDAHLQATASRTGTSYQRLTTSIDI
jgi:L-ascorbate metabolism protein UlaG (beta-lactamase superfamily)